MSLKRRLIDFPLSFANPDQLAKLSDEIAPIISMDTSYGPIRFRCRSEKAGWRVRTLFTKDRGTILWLDSLAPGTLWDVGANIGIHSLYAAKRGHTVWAFEPQPLSYAALAENAAMARNVHALPIAFGAETKIAEFRASELTAGEARAGLGHEGDVGFAAMVYRIDDFIEQFGLTPPDFLKLDVDGIELDILRGATKTLSKVREAQIEIDIDHTAQYLDLMKAAGLTAYTCSLKAQKLVRPPGGETGEFQYPGSALGLEFVPHTTRFAIDTRFRRAP